MKSLILAASLLALPLATQSRDSEDAGGYAFAYGGVTKHDLSRARLDAATVDVLGGTSLTTSLDDSSYGLGLSLGYRLSRYVGLEAGYVTLGEARYRSRIAAPPGPDDRFDFDLSVRGATLGAAVFAPIGAHLDLHARGGVLFAHSTMKGTVVFGGQSDSDSISGNSRDGWYGYGIGWSFSEALVVTVDSTHYRGVGDRSETIPKDVELLGASVLYRF